MNNRFDFTNEFCDPQYNYSLYQFFEPELNNVGVVIFRSRLPSDDLSTMHYKIKKIMHKFIECPSEEFVQELHYREAKIYKFLNQKELTKAEHSYGSLVINEIEMYYNKIAFVVLLRLLPQMTNHYRLMTIHPI